MTGSPIPPPLPPKKTGVFPDAQWLCSFLVVFTIFLFATRPVSSTGQLIFRLTLLIGGLVGLLILWLRKKKAE